MTLKFWDRRAEAPADAARIVARRGTRTKDRARAKRRGSPDRNRTAKTSCWSMTGKTRCWRLRRFSTPLGQNLIEGEFRQGGAAAAVEAGIRRHPDGCLDAGDGRLRNRGAYPETARVRAHADHFRHLDRQFARIRCTAGYSLGAVDYILTPIVPEVLRAKVCVFVEFVAKDRADQTTGANGCAKSRRRNIAGSWRRPRIAWKRKPSATGFSPLALDMLGIADFDGHLLQVNPSWEKVLGYTEQELQAISGLELVHPDDAAMIAGKWRNSRAARRSHISKAASVTKMDVTAGWAGRPRHFRRRG